MPFISGQRELATDIQGSLQNGNVGNDHLSKRPGEFLQGNSNTAAAYSLFGSPEAAKQRANAYRDIGSQLGGQRSFVSQTTDENIAARNLQKGALDAYGAQIAGAGPSMAPSVMRRGMDAAAARGNMAGPGAGSQRQAMLGAAANAGMVAQGAAGTRAGEVAGAQQAYMQGANRMVADDIGSAQQQAGRNMAARQFGDAMQGQYEDLALGMEETQMHGQQARLAGLVGARDNFLKAYRGREALDYDRQQTEANMLMGGVGTGIGAAGSLSGASIMAGGGGTAKSPIIRKNPY